MDAPGIPVEISDHYEHDVDESTRISEGFGSLELVRTREIIERHLPGGRLRVLDVGGGAGVHARWLGQAGHVVELVDPVPRHVGAAAAIAADGLAVTAQLGDARALPGVDGTFDVVLMLGPLYHLTERSDRLGAWREALRVVRPGGLVVAAAISRFASLFDGLVRGALDDDRFRRIVESDLRDGQHRNPDRISGWFTTAYFHLPDELETEAAEAGATVVELVGVEGLAGWLPHLAQRWADAATRATIVDSARVIESEPTLRGLSAHMLVVTRRPQ
jgi:SAM-dependent methyltransferase